MSLLYDEQLNDSLDQNGGESIRHIDAGALQGIGVGVATGLSNAGTSLERIAANVGNAQMRVTGAQMLAGAALTGSDETEEAGQYLVDAKPPAETQLPQYKTFDSEQVGTAGIILGGLAQQVPSLAAMVVNPVAGAVLAAAQGQTEAHAEGAKLGLTGEALENYGTVGGLTAGVGASIPGFAGFGKGAILYGSRFLLGGLANSATGEVDRWGRASILDDAGFHDQAKQMRQADAASRVTEFVLGGAFGLLGGGHRTESPELPVTPITSVHDDAAISHLIHDNYVTESAPGLATDASAEAAHVKAMDAANESIHAGKAVDVSDHINDERAFLVKGDIDAGNIERAELSDNATTRVDNIVQASEDQAIPQPKSAEPAPGVISEFTDKPFDALREQVASLRETHPELADIIAPHLDAIEAEHTTAHQESKLYDVAAACAMKYGN